MENTEIEYVGKGSKWEEWPIYNLLKRCFEDAEDIWSLEDLYKVIEADKHDIFKMNVRCSRGYAGNYNAEVEVNKNEALDILHQLMLLVNGTSYHRYSKAIYQLHHEHQYPANMITDMLYIFNIDEQPTQIFRLSQSYFEKLEPPKWLQNVLKSTSTTTSN
ncbi:MAG TPA: hypothetical protein ENI23_11375 [bacterium]|nr:hypothetical protein [bacterium]